jgi:hypothetical protein
MYTKQQIKNLKKGFYPSLTDVNGSRKQRRFSKFGQHRNKAGIMRIIGIGRFLSYIQVVENKRILHWKSCN